MVTRQRIALLACAACLLSFVGGACTREEERPVGGVLLVIGEDASLGLDRLAIEITSKGKVLQRRDYRVPSEAQLPTSLAIASNGDPHASVQIAVIGWRGDQPVDRRDHLVENVPTERVAALAVVLSARCTSLVELDAGNAKSRCESGRTCDPSNGTCASSRVDASTLATATTIEAALPPRTDADSGTRAETGPDGGARDPYTAAVLADGPRAYFRFEETSGTACASEVDALGITCVYPQSGVARGVPGSGASRTGVRIEDPAAQLNIFGATDYAGDAPFSIEAWISFETISPTQFVFVNQLANPGRTGQVMTFSDALALRTETWADGGLTFYTLAKSPAQTQKWTHVVYGYSASLGRDFLYVDGAQGDGQRLDQTRVRVATSAPLSWQGGKFTLDDVAIYSKALEPAQIAAHFAAR